MSPALLSVPLTAPEGVADFRRVVNQELSEILVRRRQAGQLPPKTVVAAVLTWCRDGWLRPSASIELLTRLLETKALTPADLKAALDAWQANPPPPRPSTDHSPARLIELLTARLERELLEPAALAAVARRWYEVGLLPPEARSLTAEACADLAERPLLKDLRQIAVKRHAEDLADLLRGRREAGKLRLEEVVRHRQEAGIFSEADQAQADAQVLRQYHHQAGFLTEEETAAADSATPPPTPQGLVERALAVPGDRWERFLAQRQEARCTSTDGLETLLMEALVLEVLWREEVSRDLVGLALSGGGIRSACFNLGLLQALHDHRLLGHVDYLSTVSGGGYIGSHLASHFQKDGVGLDDGQFPLKAAPTGEQPPAVVDLIRNGSYLNAPLKLLNHYLIGLVYHNLVYASAIIFLCATVAFLWRLLDVPPIHTWIIWASGGYLIDVYRPFLPCAILLAAWMIVWGVYYWAWLSGALRWWVERLLIEVVVLVLFGALGWLVHSYFGLAMLAWLLVVLGAYSQGLVDRVKHWSRRLLFLAGASFLIGWAVWLGNPHINTVPAAVPVSPIRAAPLQKDKASQPAVSEPQYDADAMKAPYITVPQSFIGYLLLFLVVALLPFLRPKDLLRSGEKPKNQLQHWIFRAASAAALVGVPLAVIYFVARYNVSGQNTKLARPFSPSDVVGWENFLKTTHDEHKHYQDDCACDQPIVDETLGVRIFGRLKEKNGKEGTPVPLAKAEDFRRLERERQRLLAELNRARVGYFLNSSVERESSLVVLTDGWGKYRQGTQQLDALADLMTQVLRDPRLSEDLSGEDVQTIRWSAQRLARIQDPDIGPGELTNEQEASQLLKLLDRRLVDLDAGPDKELGMSPGELLAFHHLWLRAAYPNDVRRVSMVLRTTVVEADQVYRLWVMGISLCVFLALLLFVNVNATSPQGFYRQRLTLAYIAEQGAAGGQAPSAAEDNLGSRTIPLHELKTTQKGAPYLLMTGAINILGGQPSNAHDSAGFLFSKLYCGAERIGYEATTAYAAGQVDLGRAMAISGAAISPMRVRNQLVALLMTTLNLRLGEWLPRPQPHEAAREPAGRWRRFVDALRRWPTVGGLLVDWFHDVDRRKHFFISDGGHDENLGVEPLLLRRCRLIIASDAGQDQDHTFLDFVKLFRRMRLRGIRLVTVDDKEKPLALDVLTLEMPSGKCHRHFLCARILYPDNSEGLLVYLKPSFIGDELPDLVSYRRHNATFPHDPTLNQMYDVDAVESYRQLGEHIGDSLCARLASAKWDGRPDVAALLKLFGEPEPGPSLAEILEVVEPKPTPRKRGNNGRAPGATTTAPRTNSPRP